MIESSKSAKFRNFMESLTVDKLLIDTISDAFSACFEAHEGIIRNIHDIVNKYNLKAKSWPYSIKQEIFTDIDHSITGRESLGTTGKLIGNIRDLDILNTEFGKSQLLSLSLNSLDTQTINNMRERITLLFADPTQKIYKISNVPNDIQRYYHQYSKAKSNGADSLDPVLFINRNGKYELYEGNHRLLAVIKLAVEPMVDSIMDEDYDVANLIPDEIPGLQARIFKQIPNSDIKFLVNAYVGIPPEHGWMDKIKSLKESFVKLFS